MRVERIRIEEGPPPYRARLAADVHFEGKSHPESLWFAVPEDLRESLSVSGNPWLAALAPLAATLGEALEIDAAVDRTLAANVHHLMRIWRCWYPELSVVPVHASSLTSAPQGDVGRTAALFSGGVDSFFTVLRHDAPATSSVSVDDLLCVWGFDIPLANEAAFARMATGLDGAASGLGKTLVAMSTNLRETRWRQASWGRVSHGCALAAAGLALECRYSTVRIGASVGYRNLIPWGSHPVTDPLLSTGGTAIVHDGATYSRMEKIAAIASAAAARSALRVCWVQGMDDNCGRCSKCLRTMTALYILGILDEFETFPAADFSTSMLRRVYSNPFHDRDYMRELAAAARDRGMNDVAADVEAGLRYSYRCDRAESYCDRLAPTLFAPVGRLLLSATQKRAIH